MNTLPVCQTSLSRQEKEWKHPRSRPNPIQWRLWIDPFRSAPSSLSSACWSRSCSTDWFHSISRPSITSSQCKTNIRSLQASKAHQIKVLAPDQSQDYFDHLRSLDLKHISSNLVQSMVSRISFPHLQRLKLDISEDDERKTWSYSQHFLDANNCHRLRTYNDVEGIMDNIPSVLSVEHLSISGCTAHHFLTILGRSPSLKCFRTGLDFTNRSLRFVASFPIPCFHALTQLHVIPYGYSQLSVLIYLLQCVPRVRHLRLRAQLEGQPDCVDPVFWEKFFHTHLLELKQLSLCVNTIDSGSSNNPIWNYLKDSEAIAKQMAKSNYWSGQRWKATFRNDPPSFPGGIYSAEFTVVS